MIEGYSDRANMKPNLGWWMQQINAATEWRKVQTYQNRWNSWRDMYRGNWAPDIVPVNLFFTMMNTMVPRVYFRNPTVSITPGIPGRDAMLFARVLQRLDNKMLGTMNVKQAMKRMVRDGFMFGTGIGKLGFGGMFSPGIQPQNTASERVAYGGFGGDNMPWFRRVPPERFLVPEHTTFIDENTRWIAFEHTRALSDVKADESLLPARKDVVSYVDLSSAASIKRTTQMVNLYEVQDTKTGMTFIFAPGGSDQQGQGILLYIGPDEMQQIRQTSAYPLIFNENDNLFWGVPDSKILEPFQAELNETRTQIMKHRRASVVKILAKIRGISETEAEKIVSEEVSPVVWVDGDPNTAIKLITGGSIPQELRGHVADVMQDVRESMGMSRNQLGEFNSQSGDTTATEAQIVNRAMEIRVDERRDICADILTDLVGALHEMMFIALPDEVVVDMAGPGGALVWVKFKKELIKKGRYTVNIDPDSSVPQTQELRQQRAMQNYQILSVNPFIDPVKLTQYMMSEMVGHQFDDMMRPYDPFTMMMQQADAMGMDPTAGQTAQNPMDLQQFGAMSGMAPQGGAGGGGGGGPPQPEKPQPQTPFNQPKAR